MMIDWKISSRPFLTWWKTWWSTTARHRTRNQEEGTVDRRTQGGFPHQWRIWQAGFLCSWTGQLNKEVAVLVVADALRREGINARVTGATAAIESDEASSVFPLLCRECVESWEWALP